MQPSAPLPSSPFPSSPFPSSPPARPRVLVLGVGGIGGIAAAHLFEGGACDVVAVARSAPVREAVATHGFRLRGLERARAVPGRVDGEIPPGAFDFVILATQPPEVEAAAQAALPHLAPGGRLVCFQNGLCEERVARVVGDPGRVLGGVVAWGGNMVEPGVFERTSIGGFVLGRLDGGDEPALDVLARLLGPIGPVKRTPNLRGARWSKLAINCAISSLGTVAGVRLGELIQKPVRTPVRAGDLHRVRRGRPRLGGAAREGRRYARRRLDRPERSDPNGAGSARARVRKHAIIYLPSA
jgi:2-dehydropantoate 2-reductase